MKITLDIDSKLLDLAKRLAGEKGLTLSGLVEDYFTKLERDTKIDPPKDSKTAYQNLIKLRGILGPLPENLKDKDYKEIISEYLDEKYRKE